MTIFQKLGIAAVLAISSALLTPGAMATHAPEPQQVPAPQQAPQPEWSGGFYYLVDFALGDTEDPGTNINSFVETDLTIGVGLGFGYRLGMVRMEARYFNDYNRVYDVDVVGVSPLTPGDYGGSINVEGGMANFYVDLPGSGGMRPYLGVGMGVTDIKVNYNDNDCILFFCSTINEIVVDRDWAWARQAMLGFSHRQEGSATEMFVGYRYFETQDLDFVTVSGTPFVQDKLQSHTINFGFRFMM